MTSFRASSKILVAGTLAVMLGAAQKDGDIRETGLE